MGHQHSMLLDDHLLFEEPPFDLTGIIADFREPEENENEWEEDDEHDPFSDEENVIPNDFYSIIAHLSHLWVVATINHKISVQGATYLWKIAFQWIGKIMEMKTLENIAKVPQFPHLRRKIISQLVPDVKIELGYKNLQTGEIIKTTPSSVAHVKNYQDQTKFQKLFEITSIPLKNVLKIHSNMCRSHQQFDKGPMKINISCDGVADAKSNSVTMDIFSVCFPECSNVYPLVTIKAEEKGSVSLLEQLTKITKEMILNNVILKHVLGDNPMRAMLRNCKNHSSYFSCEYCTSSAVFFEDPARSKELKLQETNHLKRKRKYEEEIRNLSEQPSNSGDNIIAIIEEKMRAEDLEMQSAMKKRKKVRNNFFKFI